MAIVWLYGGGHAIIQHLRRRIGVLCMACAQEQKRKEARKRKREREEQARLRARFGDAIPSSEGALEASAVAVSADAEEGVVDAAAVRGASSEPCNEGPVYDLGLPSGFDDSVVPMAC